MYRVATESLNDIFMGSDQPNYKAMAELRYQIRRFLRFSENAAREAGIEPQQHQLLMAVKGLPEGLKPTIGALAERMQLQHHSTVELIDRLVDRGFLCRLRATDDRRQVLIKLTHAGNPSLARASIRRSNLCKGIAEPNRWIQFYRPQRHSAPFTQSKNRNNCTKG
jgi:DNA-binding MarR family transcriptional regulator